MIQRLSVCLVADGWASGWEDGGNGKDEAHVGKSKHELT